MSKAIYLATGSAVRIKGKNSLGDYELQPTRKKSDGSGYFVETTQGKVIEFYVKDVKFVYIDNSLFIPNDNKAYDFKAFGGFCPEKVYKDYKNLRISFKEFIERSDYWFSGFEYAKNDDEITINRLDFSDPSKYYMDKSYTFIISDIDKIRFDDPDTYPENKSVLEKPVDLLQKDSGKFYSKNIEIVNNLVNDEKKLYTELITYISLDIRLIFDEIILEGKLTRQSYGDIYNSTEDKFKNNNSTNFDKLPVIDQLIGILIKDWGLIASLDATNIFQDKNLNYIQTYLEGIRSFYSVLKSAEESVYFGYDIHGNPLDFNGNPITSDGINVDGQIIHISQEAKDRADDERRVAFLLKYLPVEALNVFSYDQRLNLIKDILKLKYLPQENASTFTQNNVIKIINSFANTSEADKFLNFLLEKNDGARINFENLYFKFDDGRPERYPVVSWFVEEATNRMYYIYTLYNMWKVSKFNFYSQGPSMFRGINLECFFLKPEGRKYYPHYDNVKKQTIGSQPVLNFSVTNEGNNGIDFSSQEYEPRQNLENGLVAIDEKITKVTYNVYSTHDNNQNINESKHLFGNYHIYQSISLIGYKGSFELFVPEATPIPAFLFYYAKDFEKLKQFDAALSLGIQLTIDFALFFAFGGATVFRHLEYLKYTTRIYEVFKGTATGAEVVLFYKGTSVATELATLSAGTMSSFMNYLSETALTEDDKKFYAKVSIYLLSATFIGGYLSGVARNKVNALVEEIVTHPSYAKFAQEFPDISKLISDTKGISVAEMADFRSKYIADRPNLRVIFDNSFNEELKVAFSKEYGNLTDLKVWDELNLAENSLSNFKKLYDGKIIDRQFASVIKSDADVAAILKHYAETEIRNVLEGWDFNTRWTLLKKVGQNDTVFNAYKADTDLLKAWKDFYKEANTTKKFSSMAAERQAELLAEHKANFNAFKNEPILIDTWDSVRYSLTRRKQIDFLKLLRVNKNNQNAITHTILGDINKSKSNMVGGHVAREIDGKNLRLGNGSIDISNLPKDINGVILVDESVGIEKYRTLYNAQGGIIGNRWMPKRISADEPHTLFPAHWDDDMIIEQCTSAQMNPIRSSYNGKSNGFVATSDSGVDIGWWLDIKGQHTTGYFPIFKK